MTHPGVERCRGCGADDRLPQVETPPTGWTGRRCPACGAHEPAWTTARRDGLDAVDADSAATALARRARDARLGGAPAPWPSMSSTTTTEERT